MGVPFTCSGTSTLLSSAALQDALQLAAPFCGVVLERVFSPAALFTHSELFFTVVEGWGEQACYLRSANLGCVSVKCLYYGLVLPNEGTFNSQMIQDLSHSACSGYE